jgi:hypothetical protein
VDNIVLDIFKKGQVIETTLYNGPSGSEAKRLWNFLKNKKEKDEVISISGSNLNIRLLDMEPKIDTNNIFPNYEITIKGVLV